MRRLTPSPRRGRWIIVVALLLVVTVVVGGLLLRSRFTASLPQLDGEAMLPGLGAAVTVERDALGVPTVRAANRIDAARALGFLHAQDRFFQMDLLRRQAAGELAELFGARAVEVDKRHRLHRFRSLAQRVLALASVSDRELVSAYTDGVNAGLAALNGKPFEYVLLRSTPVPWRPEDSLLATYAMFLVLNDSTGSVEAGLENLHSRVPEALFAFLAPQGTEWDAPLIGPALPAAPVPGPEVFDLRTRPPAPKAKTASLGPAFEERGDQNEADEVGSAGSNNWAVSGAHTVDGHALLANDMHLSIGVPNTWYRASLVWTQLDGTVRRVTGVTLPGAPAVVVGSNGKVAWGFTNSYVDTTDLVDIDLDPQDPTLYRTPTGPRRFEHHFERIAVRGAADTSLDAVWTIWGPIIGHDANGRPRVLAWSAHQPDAANLGLLQMETAGSVRDALVLAKSAGIPPQNFTVVDADGHIGWTVIGRIPRRIGFDGRLPTSWADGSRRWDGWLPAGQVPEVVDPPLGRIWTANARVADQSGLSRVGDGGYALGARAHQIRDHLLAIEKARPTDMLAVQLDDHAVFLARWRTLLLHELTPVALGGHAARSELRAVVATGWTGRADTASAAYRIVHDYRDTVLRRVYASFAGEPGAEDGAFFSPNRQFERPLWTLVSTRPMHLLDPHFQSWDEALIADVDTLIGSYSGQSGRLRDRTWGERNMSHFQHPLSTGQPLLSRFLDIPSRALPGDENMPRVQGPRNGASERIVVSPGHEDLGLFEMPGGQSGHPMSPHYRDGVTAWEEGKPTPFLPGPTVNLLRLLPGHA
jgi:penicillin amidase